MDRRRFVQSMGGVGLGLLAGCGQLYGPSQAPTPAPARVYRLGVFMGGIGMGAITPALREGLRNFGDVEGENLAIELRDTGERTEEVAGLAAELVSLGVDIIVATGPGISAAKEATSTIPIVSLGGGRDLVEANLVSSLARPGGNLTGLTSADGPLIGKRLQILTEAVPTAARVGILWDATLPWSDPSRWLEDAARALGMEPVLVPVPDADELASAFEMAVREHIEALYVRVSPKFIARRAQVAVLAVQHRLPSMYELDAAVRAGGLMAYMGSIPELHRRAAYYVDRILKGTKPADLPVEQPMTFDFVVNMKTAAALGITFPSEIMLQVTEVIQ